MYACFKAEFCKTTCKNQQEREKERKTKLGHGIQWMNAI